MLGLDGRDVAVDVFFDEGEGAREDLVDVGPPVADRDDAERGALPDVEMPDLGRGDAERLQPILHATHRHPLVLERLRVGQEDLHRQERDEHRHVRLRTARVAHGG
jgi:hypothetical protein